MQLVLVLAGLVVAEMSLLFVTAFLLLGMMTWIISGHLDVPFVPTPRKAFPLIFGALNIEPGDVVYELGSGDGRLLIAAALMEPRAQFVGVERNPLLYKYAQLRKRMAGSPSNLTFRREDLFYTDLSGANKLYVYLLNSVMDKLLPKFERELKNTRIASRAFQFSKKESVEIIELSKRKGLHGEHLLYVYDF